VTQLGRVNGEIVFSRVNVGLKSTFSNIFASVFRVDVVDKDRGREKRQQKTVK
jgi:hypothetical protein